MKKAILVLIAFVGTTPSARPYIWSEEILRGVESVSVLIEFNGPVESFGITEHMVKTDVELKLGLAGINVVSEVPTYLYVNICAIKHEIAQSIGFYITDIKLVQFLDSAVTIFVWDTTSIGYCGVVFLKEVIREALDEDTNEFLNDYLATKQEAE